MAASTTSAKPFGLSASEDPRANLAGRFMRAACEPVSPASLAAFRIIFGLIGVIAVVRFMANGWVSNVYIEPVYHLTYTGFDWVQPWPAWGMYFHFVALGLASLGVVLGYRYRLSIIAFFLLFTYAELFDQTTYLNHYYLVSLISFIMVFLPMGRVASLDWWLCQRKSGSKPHEHLENDGDHPTVARGTLWMLRGQLGLVYVFAGIAKLNADWLVEAQPLTIWLYNSTSTPLIGAFLREPWLPHAMSWAGAVFDLTIVGWLLWRRTRPYAYVLLALFHVATALLFPAIGMFPWIMMGCGLIFLDADWPERLLQRIRRKRGLLTPQRYEATPIAQGATASSWPVRVALLLAGLFLMLQVFLPLRHLAYPSNVRWSEEGYRFSWRVLVTEKMGLARFRVQSSLTDGEVLVYPEQYLTPTQAERAAYQPSLILATAHIIRDDFKSKGHEDVEVRVDAYVSYNGRQATGLIDPAADLASVSRGIGPKRWVLPAPR